MVEGTTTNPGLGIILTVAFLFVGFMIALLVIRYFSGWYLIERLFRTKSNCPKHYLEVQTFQVGWQTIWINAQKTSFDRVAGFVKIGVTETGIYLKFVFPYFLLLRSINLPWAEIDIQKELASENYEIIVKKILKIRIILSPILATKLLSYKH